MNSPSLDGEKAIPSLEQLQGLWRQLAARYFDDRLPVIGIEWSSRLTASAGMFVSRIGPRHRPVPLTIGQGGARVIRLSEPLLSGQPLEEVLRTLAHEMIHQWQFDIRRRRPSHGLEFQNMMHRMNHDGLGVSIYHRLHDRVESRNRYGWQCVICGYSYRRQRRTIVTTRHRCGQCGGHLMETAITGIIMEREFPEQSPQAAPPGGGQDAPQQLSFAF